jgi:hypothetical protein
LRSVPVASVITASSRACKGGGRIIGSGSRQGQQTFVTPAPYVPIRFRLHQLQAALMPKSLHPLNVPLP